MYIVYMVQAKLLSPVVFEGQSGTNLEVDE